MENNSRLQIARRIGVNAKHIRDLIAAHPHAHAICLPQPPLSPYQPLMLSPAQPIQDDLLKAGVRADVASILSTTYLNKAELLEHKLEDSYEKAITSSSVNPHLLQSVYQLQYKEALDSWLQDFLQSSSRYGFRSKPTGKQTIFNVDAVPVLEQAYVCDPYPSRDMKLALAKETGMKYRQIHVWFQNRRSRAKREGFKPCRSLRLVSGSSEASSLLSEFEHDEEPRKYEVIPRSHCLNYVCVATEDLGGPRPDHAFPATYPPTCPVDPFPVRLGQGKFVTPWLRHSVSSSVVHSQPVDVDELSQSFSALSLGGLQQDSSESIGQRADSPMISFSVVLPRAPLPSFISLSPDKQHSAHSPSIDNSDIPSTHSVIKMRAPSPEEDTKTATKSDRASYNPYPQTGIRLSKMRHIDTSLFSAFKFPVSTNFLKFSDRFTSMATQLPAWRVACA